jgi:TP901 family phage tail tape measure protein
VATVGELMVMIAGNNAPLMGSLGQSEAALRGFSSTTGTNSAASASHLNTIGIAALGVVGAVGIMGAAGVSAAADFQDRMAIINTIAHQTPEELNRTGEALRNMASQTGASLTDLTGGFYDLLSAGVSTGNAMEFLRNATTLSIGGLSTVGEAVDAITTATNAWSAAGGRAHLTQQDSALVADVFAKAIERGKVTADQISSSLANVASTAAAMNIPIQEVGATYATLTARGIPAAEATQRLNGALVALQRIPPGMQELQDKTHTSYEEIARTEGVQAAFQRLRTDAERYHISLIDVMGRQDAMAFVLNVTGAAGRQFSSDLSSMYDATGTAASQAEERMGTFNRTMDRLGAAVNSAMISVGNAALPMLSGIAEHVSEVVYAFGQWSDANPGLAGQILLTVGAVAALVAGVAFLGPVLGAIAGAVAVIVSPITLLIAALAAAAAGLGVFGETGRSAFDSVASAINGFIPQTGPLRVAFDTVRDAIANVQVVVGSVVSAITSGRSAFDALSASLSGLIPQTGPVRDGFDAIRGAIASITDAVGPVFSQIGADLASVASAVLTGRSAFDGLTSSLSGVIPYTGPVRTAFEGIRTAIALAQQAFGNIGSAIGSVVGAMQSGRSAFDALGSAISGLIPYQGPVRAGFEAIRTAIALLQTAIAQIGTWITTFVSHLLGTESSSRQAGVAVGSLATTLGTLVAAVSRVVGTIATFVIGVVDAANRLGLFKLAGDAVTLAVGLLGDAIRVLFTGMAQLAATASGVLSVAFNALVAVFNGITAAVNAATGAIGGLIKGAQDAAGAVAGIPGVKLGADVAGGAGDIIGNIQRSLPHFDLGGVVPGSGPQLVVAHGGERITPVGGAANSAPISHTTHVVLQLDGTTIAEHVERRIFNNAEGATSGFAGSPVLLD